MSNDIKVEIVKDGKVRLTLVRKDRWGSVTNRSQFTFSRRMLERRLMDASITVPWREAGRL